MEAIRYRDLETPVGPVRAAWGKDGLVAVETGDQLDGPPPAQWRHDPKLECPAVDQLQAYFRGERERFDLPLVLHGTPFQERVWRALLSIPYGETISYGELARRAGRPGAARAAGAANGRNPISIVLPCHRVVGSGGRLTGYAGGLGVKAGLLRLESERVGSPPA